MKPLNKLKKLLEESVGRNTHTPSEEYVQECLKAVEVTLRTIFKQRKPRLSPSQYNLTPRQMWFILNGYETNVDEKFKPQTRLKMILASVSEHVIVYLMKEAGVVFDATQKNTKVVIEGEEIRGNFDYSIDGKIYDLKCTGQENYVEKFKSDKHLIQNDPFGYVGQGGLYSHAAGIPFDGWHVFNMNTGQFKEVSAKNIQYEIDTAWEDFAERVAVSKSAESFLDLPQCYDTTSDGKLDWRCSRCEYRQYCFPKVSCEKINDSIRCYIEE